jgi:hypothetical protein
MAKKAKSNEQSIREELEEKSEEMNELVYSSFGVGNELRVQIEEEIELRTIDRPSERREVKNSSDSLKAEQIKIQVKDLIHHLAIEAIQEEEGGIVPIKGTDKQSDMLDLIVEGFEDIYDEYAEDRLVEVDEVLGTESAADEAYPNLRSFIEDDLFAYHVDTMENTPIVWKLSTARLLADAKGEGFACFVDYHQLDASLFDRLSNQYLEPRKAELRDRRSAANQRRNDESLSTSDRADATEEFEFCSSALEQIAELEEVMQELGSTSEREFDAEDRDLVETLAPKVAAFREETARRLDTLDRLREMHDEAWFEDTFSPSFWEQVQEWREEWLDALSELERACEAYAKPSDEPVEAHLADLFDYFNWRLKGSDHYSSTGILFMTYYFEREGADLLNEDGEPFDNLTEDERLLASLATGLDDPSVLDGDFDGSGLDEFKRLAEAIDDRCQTIYSRIPSDWSSRALSEITTAGYQPNHKHGVSINISPLAEKSMVPEIVESKVL